jgi:hypothetical protein
LHVDNDSQRLYGIVASVTEALAPSQALEYEYAGAAAPEGESQLQQLFVERIGTHYKPREGYSYPPRFQVVPEALVYMLHVGEAIRRKAGISLTDYSDNDIRWFVVDFLARAYATARAQGSTGDEAVEITADVVARTSKELPDDWPSGDWSMFGKSSPLSV